MPKRKSNLEENNDTSIKKEDSEVDRRLSKRARKPKHLYDPSNYDITVKRSRPLKTSAEDADKDGCFYCDNQLNLPGIGTTQCTKCYHEAHNDCIDTKESWNCNSCVTCKGCSNPFTSKILQVTCTKCSANYHRICHVPKIHHRTNILNWICSPCQSSLIPSKEELIKKSPPPISNQPVSAKSILKMRRKSLSESDGMVPPKSSDKRKKPPRRISLNTNAMRHNFHNLHMSSSMSILKKSVLLQQKAQSLLAPKRKSEGFKGFPSTISDQQDEKKIVRQKSKEKEKVVPPLILKIPATTQAEPVIIPNQQEPRSPKESSPKESIPEIKEEKIIEHPEQDEKLCNFYKNRQEVILQNVNIEEIPDVSDWSVNQVYEYFNEMFQDCSHRFLEQDIDGQALLLLTRHDVIRDFLKEEKVGHRFNIFRQIVKLQMKVFDPYGKYSHLFY